MCIVHPIRKLGTPRIRDEMPRLDRTQRPCLIKKNGMEMMQWEKMMRSMHGMVVALRNRPVRPDGNSNATIQASSPHSKGLTFMLSTFSYSCLRVMAYRTSKFSNSKTKHSFIKYFGIWIAVTVPVTVTVLGRLCNLKIHV